VQNLLRPAIVSNHLQLNIVNEMLDAVQVNGGKLKMVAKLFDLKILLEECV
jgi:hypothetical protein